MVKNRIAIPLFGDLMADASSDSNLFGALAYLFSWITGIIVYLAKPEDKYARFHAMQSILLGVVLFVLIILFGVFAGIISVLTLGFGVVLIGILLLPVQLGLLLLWLFLMWKAYSGEKYKLPVIGDYAEKQVG